MGKARLLRSPMEKAQSEGMVMEEERVDDGGNKGWS